MSLAALSSREASIFACVCDTVVTPEPLLPPVRHTDAVASFDRWLVLSPRFNRAGLRALLYAAELAPRAAGFGRRLRTLSREERGRVFERLDRSSKPQVRALTQLMKGIACLSYYGDDAVMAQLGYDAEANQRRGRELRALEGRP